MTESKDKIKELLGNIGYELQDCGDYLTCRADYRNGTDTGSVAIYPNTNLVIDFVTGQKFSFNEFIKVSLGLKTAEEVNDVLLNKYSFNINSITKSAPKITLQKKFAPEMLGELEKDHSYWINRGISEEVLKEFDGGICKEGPLKNRYVLKVFNSKNELLGAVGRTLVNSSIKYKILGSKNLFSYPFHINYKDIKNKREVIILESTSDLLSLFTAGIRNCMVIFGIELSNHQLTTLIKLNPRKIYISTNNDLLLGKSAGNNGAKKIYSRLSKYFDKPSLQIKLPQLANDWCEILEKFGKNEIIKSFN